MSIREAINKYPRLSIAAGVTVAAIGFLLIVWQLGGSNGYVAQDLNAPGKLFFSSDDGQSFFPADNVNLPPFDHQGKSAVRAHVIRCGGGDRVAYLERYTPEARKKLDAAAKVGNGNTAHAQVSLRVALSTLPPSGIEVKPPGKPDWVSMADFARSAEITRLACPDGTAATEEVEP
jgi:hypothetical protein